MTFLPNSPLLFPPIIPVGSQDSETKTYLIGTNIQSGQPVTFTPEERKKHYWVLGSSGKGKSFNLLNMILQDIADLSCGMILLDPHGSLYDLVVRHLSHVRPDLADRVVLFNPSGDADVVPGFNPLGGFSKEDSSFAVQMMVSSCLKAWGQHSTDQTPRISRILTNIFTVLEANDLTLIESSCLISLDNKNPYRRQLLRAVENEVVLEDWQAFEKSTLTQRTMMLEGAMNRLRKFLQNRRLQRIFGQKQRTIDLTEIIEQKKVLLVNLRPSTVVDEENCRLIGVLLVNELYRSALLREAEPVGNPSPFYCYIDEFFSFINRDLAKSLNELRKFGIFFRLANQHLDQLRFEDEQIYGSVMGNCQGKIVFGGLSADDAETLAAQLYTDPDATKEVKLWNEQTKFRPVEVPNVTVNYGKGASRSDSSSHTDARGHSDSVGKSHARSHQIALSKTEGKTRQKGSSHGITDGESLAHQKGQGASLSQSRSRGSGRSGGEGTSVSDGTNASSSDSQSRQSSMSDGRAYSQNSGVNSPSDNGSPVYQNSAGNSNTSSRSESQGNTRSHSHGKSHSESRSRNTGFHTSEQESKTVGRNVSESDTTTRSRSRQQSTSETHGTQESVSRAESNGETVSDTKTHTDSVQHSDTAGTSTSESENVSVSVGIRNQMVEFKEGSPVFYTLQEVRYRQACHLIDQPMAQATIRIENGPVLHTKITHVDLPEYRKASSPMHIEFFRRDVIDSSPQCYSPLKEAEREIRERQMEVFGTVLSFEEKHSTELPAPPEVIEGEPEIIEDFEETNDTDSAPAGWDPVPGSGGQSHD